MLKDNKEEYSNETLGVEDTKLKKMYRLNFICGILLNIIYFVILLLYGLSIYSCITDFNKVSQNDMFMGMFGFLFVIDAIIELFSIVFAVILLVILVINICRINTRLRSGKHINDIKQGDALLCSGILIIHQMCLNVDPLGKLMYVGIFISLILIAVINFISKRKIKKYVKE